ncbi:hypothetical protein AGMMS49944_26780 [Spirochaetia bacterium]|nr:hypothetical protein AGMMS49944_26780 [Spirochaetia bacterium]
MKTKSALLLLLGLSLSLTGCNNVIHDLVPWDDPHPNPTVTTIGPQSQAITIGVPGVPEEGALSANFAVTTTGILGEKPVTLEWFSDSTGMIPMGPPPGVTNASPTPTFSTNPAVLAYITLAATEETHFGVYYFRVIVGDLPDVEGGSLRSSGVGRLQIDTWLPEFNVAFVDGALLVIELTEPVTGRPDPTDFIVSGIASNPSVTDVAVNGTTITLKLSARAYLETGIMVTYNRNADSAKHLLDSDGNFTESFVDEPVTNNTAPPKFNAAAIDGVSLVIELTEPVAGTPDPSDFTVSGIAGNPSRPYVTTVLVNGATTITLTLSSPAAFGENNIKVTYKRNAVTAKHLLDADGNFTESFVDKPVTNNTGVPKRVLNIDPQVGTISAGVTGSTKFGVYTQGITGVKPVTIAWFSDASGTISGGAPLDVSIVSPVSFVATPTDITLTTKPTTPPGIYFFRVTVSDGSPIQSEGVGTLTVSEPKTVTAVGAQQGLAIQGTEYHPVYTVTTTGFFGDQPVNLTWFSDVNGTIPTTAPKNVSVYTPVDFSTGSTNITFTTKTDTPNGIYYFRVLVGSGVEERTSTGVGILTVLVVSPNILYYDDAYPPTGWQEVPGTQTLDLAFAGIIANQGHGYYFIYPHEPAGTSSPLNRELKSDPRILDATAFPGLGSANPVTLIIMTDPGDVWTIKLDKQGSLFTVNQYAELILDESIVLQGYAAEHNDPTDNNAPLVWVNSGALTMKKNSQIIGNTTRNTTANRYDGLANGYGGGVYVTGGTFTMRDQSCVTGHTVIDSYGGGGVYVTNGAFEMWEASSVKDNRSLYSGGGVIFTGSSSNVFTMHDTSSITSNVSVDTGGGVSVSGAKFVMEDSSFISLNFTRGNSGGGGGVYSTGTFIMDDTSYITQNVSSSSGGGVYSSGTFTMGDADDSTDSHPYISNNDASSGGGVYSSGGTFTMNDHAHIGGIYLTGKNTAGSGGGVYINTGRFNMNDSSAVSGNEARSNGGGVYAAGGTFTMKDNSIVGDITDSGKKNAAGGNGGGVYINTGTFTMGVADGSSSGSQYVSRNTATGSGGGVYIGSAHTNSTFTMNDSTSGYSYVRNNTATSNGGGVYLYSSLSVSYSSYQNVNNSTSYTTTCTMNGSSDISGNSAALGAGMYLDSSLSVTHGNTGVLYTVTNSGNITSTLIKAMSATLSGAVYGVSSLNVSTGPSGRVSNSGQSKSEYTTNTSINGTPPSFTVP